MINVQVTFGKNSRRSHQLLAAVVSLIILLATGAVNLSQDRNGSVSGTVIDSSTQAPISGVSVEISGIGPVTTDETGRFQISDVPPGKYNLQAVRSGMTAVVEDRLSWSVNVASGEDVRNVRLRMASFGVIRGHIRDDHGNPLSGVSVHALVLTYQKGRRVLIEPSLAVGILNSSAETNGGGEYLLDLPVGAYYVCVQMRTSNVSEASAARVMGGAQKIYYPGTPDAAFASPVTLSGQEAAGIDINVAASGQATHKVYVRVEGLAAASRNFIPAGAQIAELQDRFSLEHLPVLGLVNRGIGAAADGIVIDGVPNGSYDLLMDGGMEGGVRGRGMTPIDMRGEDLHDVVVSLQPPQDIVGIVTGVDPSRTISFSGLKVMLGTRSASVEPNGKFVVPTVLTGFYSVTLDGLPPEAYVSDIRYGGISLHEAAHDLNGPELQAGLSGTPLQIVVAVNGGSIEGMVDEQDAAAGATVVLTPDSSRRFIQSDYKATFTRSNGAFSFKGVPPGVYQLFAWQSIPDTAWLNPEFMSRWEGRGQIVSIKAGESVTARVRLFSKSD